MQLLSDGSVNVLEQIAASGTSGFANGGTTGPEVFGTTDGFIDLDITDDGKYLYQLQGLSGAISAYEINANTTLSLVQEAEGFLPEVDTQGLVTFQRHGVGENSGLTAILKGDVNLDGTVAFSDIPAFITLLTSGTFQAEGDCNEDGEVTFADIPAFIEILIAAAQ